MPQEDDKRKCIRTDENGKECGGTQTFKKNAKPPGWHTHHAKEKPGWKCDDNPEHFDEM
jgi:hypothetical protein